MIHLKFHTSTFLLLIQWSLSGQVSQINEQLEIYSIGNKVDTAYYLPEIKALFPGGDEGLSKFLVENLYYPVYAKDNHIEGNINVQFIIHKSGEVISARITRSAGKKIWMGLPDELYVAIVKSYHLLDEEALRVVRNMPAWRPSFNKGIPVSSIWNILIRFKD